jgi:thiol-disulfide isomerase/thioredoxin
MVSLRGRGFALLMVAALILVALALASPAIRADEPDTVKLGEFIPAATPQPAPELSLIDLKGNPAALSDFKGKFVLVNLWATWCQPCLKEMPSLVSLQTQLGPTLTVVAVSEDRGAPDVISSFIEKMGLDKLKVYLDPKGAATQAFAARGLPSSFLIDPDGKVIGKVEGGADWNSDAMRAALAKVLPAVKPS